MPIYYISVAALSCFTLVIMMILVYENGRYPKAVKNRFYGTYFLIILALLSELTSVLLNGAPAETVSLHKAIKAVDYILTPVAAVMFVRQVCEKSRWYAFLTFILSFNVIIQVLSIFAEWTFYVDEANIYHHGPLYPLYMAIYCIALFAVISVYVVYGRNFSKENWVSLCAIGLFVCAGVGIQEIVGGETRTICIALSVGSVLQYIHYNEFLQLKSDDVIRTKTRLLELDPLTEMNNRYAYNEFIKNYDNNKLDDDMVVASIDVNGLKVVNDTLGHLAGDELIKGAANCISSVFSKYGKCFRTGGDEFIVIFNLKNNSLESIKTELKDTIAGWSGKLVDSVSLSSGYVAVSEMPDANGDELLKVADKRMYDDKNLYYKKRGIDREGRRAAYDAICSSYEKILKVNLLEDNFIIIKIEQSEMSESMGYNDVYSTWVKEFAILDYIHLDDRHIYADLADNEKLMQHFNEGDKYFCVKYRRRDGKGFKDVLTEVIPTDDYSKEMPIVYLYVKDITNGIYKD